MKTPLNIQLATLQKKISFSFQISHLEMTLKRNIIMKLPYSTMVIITEDSVIDCLSGDKQEIPTFCWVDSFSVVL